ncbi:MAG: hypothetical protein KDC43_24310 [Saprospiraceae bacterium]|nr:hypothetical protein [Saprospiraceae bacterium]MCB0626952.1 hypothetical protein [Saprospiraceae bacterium]MCB0679073.1 hypothetical protein [Saprospiraceae bacterium]MCB0679891.1 hypothetical protein [Saprospiraceae bacterium]
MKRNPINALLFGLLLTAATACTEDPPPTLDGTDRKIIDSLYQMEVNRIKPVLDSLCESRFDSLLQVAVDSILEVRNAEIEKQLNRIREQQQ